MAIKVSGVNVIDNSRNVDAGIGTYSGDVVIADKIVHSGDTNTAIRFPAADTVAVETAGSEALRVDSSGRLLVGTTSTSASCTAVITGRSDNPFSNPVLRIDLNDTSPADGDALGNISFSTTGQSSFDAGAWIAAFRDGGTWTNESSHPTRLVFSTAADGASSPTERMRIDSQGRMGLGTVSPDKILTLREDNAGGEGASIRLHNSSATVGSNNKLIFTSSTNATFQSAAIIATRTASGTTIAFESDGTNERLRIDESGRLLVGTTSARSNFYNSTVTQQVQVEGTTYQNSGISLVCNSTSTGDTSLLMFGKSATSSKGSNTLVANNHLVGGLTFQGNDGSQFVECASFQVEIDGTPGANDMPGRILFKTTADGASSPTERMRITSAGYMGLGTQSPSSTLDVGTGNIEIGGGNNTALTWSSDVSSHYLKFTTALNGLTLNGYGGLAFETNGANERMRIDSSGRLLVGTSTAPLIGGTYGEMTVHGDGTQVHFVSNTAGPAYLNLAAGSSGNNITSSTVQGRIRFYGWNTDAYDRGAEIAAETDGTPGNGDIPTRLVFSTTQDGQATPTERLRIANTGAFGLSGANYGTSGQVLTSNGSSSTPTWQDAGGGWTLQGSSSISGSANIDFETFPAGINFVRIVVAEVSASGSVNGNGILSLQLKQSGSVNSATSYTGVLRYNVSNQARTNVNKWALVGTSSVQNSTSAQFVGVIDLVRMSDRWSVSAVLQDLVADQGWNQFNGFFNANANDISGVRLSIEGTNYDAGQMTCYYM
jgi:hypothetical protein